ncbi:uncharacterized protein BCR38DRAFT_486360 [Pseudomassariella vexata]|uniref:Homeobox domain-containing protein n=1 Tax=Pseudomassariella vexata TaxID=1141098 RepID=A0A1Y2DS47_9PEZI|nr:uncharacterized protein BCR38DRAFT_486360 [Pseudomassariella vexata]ORY62083.1 hypothetical protein BCR38DRAFT_486360 [Pseudomassariella vexata]
MDMQFCAQSNFNPMFNLNHGQGTTMQYSEGQYPVYHGFHGLQYMYPPHPSRNHRMPEHNSQGDGKTESKPRLSKEEVEKLEKVFQENPKPSSSVKAQLADGLGLERPRINNWFQNRRAKAKQERKQEEYEARRAAEKTSSEPNSPIDPTSGVSELFNDDLHQRMKPSSALFPGLSSASLTADALYDDSNYEDDATGDSEDFGSPFAQPAKPHQDDVEGDFQSPLSLDYSRSDNGEFAYTPASQNFSHEGQIHTYAPFMPSHQNSRGHLDGGGAFGGVVDELPSSEEQSKHGDYQATHYLNPVSAGYTGPTLPFFATTTIEEQKLEEAAAETQQRRTPEGVSDDGMKPEQQSTPSICLGLATPGDSFKSPPPPANIASRRNIPRPAALNSAALRSLSYNLGGGAKTAMEGSRRADPSSPATAMRRIASTNGPLTGRIQKSSAGPRSPMYFNRNTEALLHYHSRSPGSTIGSTFSGAAPPTPMTPLVMSQQGMREPTVTSNCSEDEGFMLGTSISGVSAAGLMHDLKAEPLKTPPGTPGLMTNFGYNFGGHPFSAGTDFSADQPLLTPYFRTEFPDLPLRNFPSYVDLSDASLPSTPAFPHMMSLAQDHGQFVGPVLGTSREYDWDANESVTSSKSSPGQPRSRAIQFTQNMTPQDYTSIQEK